MSAPNTTDMCVTAFDLASSTFHKCVLCFKILTCICGLIANIRILKTEGIRWLAHPNAKFIYKLQMFWTTFIAITYAFPMVFDLIRFSVNHDDYCAYTTSAFVGFWVRFVPAFGINAQSYAMFALAVERCVATLYLVRYEKVNSALLGILLGVFSIAAPAAQLYFCLVVPNKYSENVVATSILTPDNGKGYDIHLRILQVLEFSTLILFVGNFAVNIIQSKRVTIFCHNQHGLNAKYQVKETRKVLSALVPCFLIHFCLFFFPPIILDRRLNAYPPLSPAEKIQWIECLSNYQLYALFLPLVIYVLRNRDRRRVIVDDHKNADHYFKELGLALR